MLISGSNIVKAAANIIKGGTSRRRHTPTLFPKITWLQEKILKHQEDEIIKKFQIGNLSVLYKRPYELLHSYREICEKEIYCFNAGIPDPLVIDCGSNIGLSILYFKKLYPNSKVIAFEPDEGSFNLLRQNVDNNNLTNIELHKAAVWITDGEISFEANESEASHIKDSATGYKVSSVRLNDLLQQFTKIDFLKIDIEGAEWQVVIDSSENLHKVQNMFLEYHGKVEDTQKIIDLLNILNNCGFKVYIKNAADNIHLPFIENRTNHAYDVQLNLFCYR